MDSITPVTGSGAPSATIGDQKPANNHTLFQGFEWYCPADRKHWKRLAEAVPALAGLGISSIWIPPATKSFHQDGNGYDAYDLYDLGEFNQKGATSTKWGTKQELVDLATYADEHGIAILFDAVLNHKAGADYAENVKAVKVDPKDRNKVTGKPESIKAWTGFDFKGRAGAYSSMKWNKSHFTGVDFDDKSKTSAIWLFEGKSWAYEVDEELGNCDYLMFADIDHQHPEVREDIFNWVRWLSSQLRLGGLRLDGVKHYSGKFLRDIVRCIDRQTDSKWFLVGEYWREDSEVLTRYIDYMDEMMSLFDFRLVKNFSRLSLSEGEADLRTMFNDALCALKPQNAVTFVRNHDTQPGRSHEIPVATYFVPIAYSLILLRADAGLPCVFYADLYGSFDRGTHRPPPCGGNVLPKLMLARFMYAHGTQIDYFDEPESIGFTRTGHPSRYAGAGLAVVINNGWTLTKKAMAVGTQHANETWTDLLNWCRGDTVINSDGCGAFYAGPRSVSVWASRDAVGRERLDGLIFDWNIYGSEKAACLRPEPEERPRKRPRNRGFPEWLRLHSKTDSERHSNPGSTSPVS